MLLSSTTMRVISWNFKCLNASKKKAQIKCQLDACGADIILLQETKTSQENFESSIMKWGKWNSLHVPAQGALGGLVALWDSKK